MGISDNIKASGLAAILTGCATDEALLRNGGNALPSDASTTIAVNALQASRATIGVKFPDKLQGVDISNAQAVYKALGLERGHSRDPNRPLFEVISYNSPDSDHQNSEGTKIPVTERDLPAVAKVVIAGKGLAKALGSQNAGDPTTAQLDNPVCVVWGGNKFVKFSLDTSMATKPVPHLPFSVFDNKAVSLALKGYEQSINAVMSPPAVAMAR